MKNERTRLNTTQKFWLSFFIAVLWAILIMWVVEFWIDQLSDIVGYFLAYTITYGIAVIPGFFNALLVSSLLMDKRPKIKEFEDSEYPPITLLIAAYNEEENIDKTMKSIFRQEYPNKVYIIISDDGSVDRTKEKAFEWYNKHTDLVTIVSNGKNRGKSYALNRGLDHVTTELFINIDADSTLFKNALKNLVGRYLSDPPTTAAVAGAVFVGNSRTNFVTKLQEWDYFHAIAATKRIQSLQQCTLVTQGAFSIFKTEAVIAVGGWKHTVGEDIVLTWDLLKAGYRTGYAENACLFTEAPTTWVNFIKQRVRWSRGVIEAFKEDWHLLFRRRRTTLFIWINLMFPYVDFIYTFFFLPGVILALFGYYFIAGPMTLMILPLALLINWIMYYRSKSMFKEQELCIRKNRIGFLVYVCFYHLCLQPICLTGYIKEIFNSTKKWGTK